MKGRVLMKCGHVSTGIRQEPCPSRDSTPGALHAYRDGVCEFCHGAEEPVCASCYGITPDATKIDTTMTMDVLAGRTAKCTYCSNTQPSSFDLPFFEFRGANSFLATNMCACGYLKVAHVNQEQGDRHPITDHAFTAVGPYATDGYYCGCRGWD